jgi:hypothetical protein
MNEIYKLIQIGEHLAKVCDMLESMLPDDDRADKAHSLIKHAVYLLEIIEIELEDEE